MKKRKIIYAISLVCIIIGSLFTVIQQPIRVGVDDKEGRIVEGKELFETESSRNEENEQTANRQVARLIDPSKKLVALTFDDGPSEYTRRILRTLKQYDSVATFFVVGNRVELFEDVLKEELEIGCEIGNHTYEHKVLTELNAEQIWLQIYRTNEAVKKVTGEYPTLMRPPCGFDNGSTNCIIAMPLILWSVDTKDWQTQNCYCSVQTVLENVKDIAICRLTASDVVGKGCTCKENETIRYQRKIICRTETRSRNSYRVEVIDVVGQVKLYFGEQQEQTLIPCKVKEHNRQKRKQHKDY